MDVRLANLGDVNQILEINSHWTVSSLDILEKENGFLYCEKYKASEIEKMIIAEEIAVASNDNKVIAYYINDNYSSHLAQYKNAIEMLKSENKIAKNARVSLRTQIVVEKDFQRMGIPTAMLNFIKPLLRTKYDFLFSIGINENPKRIAHEKAGWEIVYQNNEIYYCYFNLKK